MLDDLTEHERAERDKIISQVILAFGDVVRAGDAITWTECVAIDNHEYEYSRDAARSMDADTHWRDLIDDPNWTPFPGIGGFSFINAEGFKYYLPPTMIRFLRGDITEWYPGHLLSVMERFIDPVAVRELWSVDQLRCIARFIAFMAKHDYESQSEPDEPNPWSEAIKRGWGTHLQAS